MNDGWFMRAMERLSGHVLVGWLIVFCGMGRWFGVHWLFVLGVLPFIVLLSVGIVGNTIEWCEDTWEYIKRG